MYTLLMWVCTKGEKLTSGHWLHIHLEFMHKDNVGHCCVHKPTKLPSIPRQACFAAWNSEGGAVSGTSTTGPEQCDIWLQSSLTESCTVVVWRWKGKFFINLVAIYSTEHVPLKERSRMFRPWTFWRRPHNHRHFVTTCKPVLIVIFYDVISTTMRKWHRNLARFLTDLYVIVLV